MMTKLILLVEDDENDVFFFQRAMNSAGILNPVQVANDGQTAIEYLQGTEVLRSRGIPVA